MNARLDDELAAKLEALRQRTRKTTTAVVREALEEYYERVTAEPRVREALVESGFVGCAEGPVDLSDRYKDALTDSLSDKA